MPPAGVPVGASSPRRAQRAAQSRLFVCLFVYLFVCLFVCLLVCGYLRWARRVAATARRRGANAEAPERAATDSLQRRALLRFINLAATPRRAAQRVTAFINVGATRRPTVCNAARCTGRADRWRMPLERCARVCVCVSQALDAHDRHMFETLTARSCHDYHRFGFAALRCAVSPFLSSLLLRLGQVQPLQPVAAVATGPAVATGRSRCNRSQPLQRPVAAVATGRSRCNRSQPLQPVAAVATGRSRCNRSQPVGGVQRQDRRTLAGDRRLHGRARRSGRRVSQCAQHVLAPMPTSAPGLAGLIPPTSARGQGSCLPHLHRGSAHACHICAGTRRPHRREAPDSPLLTWFRHWPGRHWPGSAAAPARRRATARAARRCTTRRRARTATSAAR